MTSRPTLTDSDGVIAELPDLTIEARHTEDMVILQQIDHSGQVDRIAIHKWQVLLLARHFGVLGKSAAPAPHAAELGRRLHVLHGRIDHLSHMLHYGASSDHAALEPERIYSFATCEIADAFIADVKLPVRVPLAGGAGEARNATKNGGVSASNTPEFPFKPTENGGVSGFGAPQETTR